MVHWRNDLGLSTITSSPPPPFPRFTEYTNDYFQNMLQFHEYDDNTAWAKDQTHQQPSLVASLEPVQYLQDKLTSQPKNLLFLAFLAD